MAQVKIYENEAEYAKISPSFLPSPLSVQVCACRGHGTDLVALPCMVLTLFCEIDSLISLEQ